MDNKTYNLNNPRIDFDPDYNYGVKGDVLNGIGQEIHRLKTELEEAELMALKEELNELRLRDKNPSLRDAWDHYRTVLGLVKKQKVKLCLR